MLKILSTFPNSLLAQQDPNYHLAVHGLTTEEAKTMVHNTEFESCVGHESTAEFFSTLLGVEILTQRSQLNLEPDSNFLVGLFTPPRRLQEGQKWTEEEILSMPVNWVNIVRKPTMGIYWGVLDSPLSVCVKTTGYKP